MKRFTQHALLGSLAVLLVQPLPAADAAKPQQLIDRAIEAMGGKQALDKSRHTIIEDKGTYYGMGDGIPYEGRYVFVLANPGRFRMEIIGQFVSVTDKDKAWISAMGNTMDLTGEPLETAKRDLLVHYATSLIPLEKPNEKFKLRPAGTETIEGDECEAFTIDHEGMPTVTMYFSKKTGLIRKTKYKTKAPELGFQEVTDETIYHEYKDFAGVKSPSKMTVYRDGKKFVESTPQKMSFPKEIDESEFKKPE